MPAPALASSKTGRPIPDLSEPGTRHRLTPAAVEAYLNLAQKWRLTSRQAASLLGEGSERTWFRIKASTWEGPFSQDALTRVSALVGVYKGLQILFSDPLADEWVRLPNSEALFGGRSPLDHMIAGGIPAMIETRRYVDALRGGV